MPPDTPDPEDAEADAPDPWEEADRAWERKWADEPLAEEVADPPLDPPPASYRPRKTTASGTTDAYGEGMRAAGPYLGLGIQIATSMALFAGLGIAVDRWLDTAPWGTIIGAALGMVGIVLLIIRVANEASGKGR